MKEGTNKEPNIEPFAKGSKTTVADTNDGLTKVDPSQITLEVASGLAAASDISLKVGLGSKVDHYPMLEEIPEAEK